jgi:hypothetical protein
MNIGCIIRSVGERTEKLCIDSVKRHLAEDSIHMIRNVKPFSSALDRMFEIAIENDYDWYFGLDADVILVKDWLDKLNTVVSNLDRDCYRIDFPVKDRFLDKITYAGTHFYNHRFTREAQKMLERTRNDNKPEGNIRHLMSQKEHLEKDVCLGYHGFEQYRRDIFARFALRYKRDSRYVKRHRIFREMDEEKEVAKAGWEYAKTSDLDFTNFDSREVFLKKTEKLDPLKIPLDDFYKKMDEMK